MEAYSSGLIFAALEAVKVNERVAGLSPELYILIGLTHVWVCRPIHFLNWTLVG